MGKDMQQAFDLTAADPSRVDAMAGLRSKARAADAASAAYLKSVNMEMNQRAAIRYIDIYKSLHGDLQMLRDAAERGVTPSDFAERTILDFGLMRNGGDIDPDLVRGFNRAQAAICEFAMSSDQWRLGTDGCVYHESDDGLGSLRPLKVKDGRQFGFGVLFHEGASLGADGRAVNRGEGEPVSGRSDIADAVREYEKRFAPGVALGMG